MKYTIELEIDDVKQACIDYAKAKTGANVNHCDIDVSYSSLRKCEVSFLEQEEPINRRRRSSDFGIPPAAPPAVEPSSGTFRGEVVASVMPAHGHESHRAGLVLADPNEWARGP